MQLIFFLPDIHRLYTGGNIFNQYLSEHLKESLPVKNIVIPTKFNGLDSSLPASGEDIWVIDSLLLQNQGWMDFLLKQMAPPKILLVHYLHLLDTRDKSDSVVQREKAYLPLFQGFITTSDYSQQCLRQVGVSENRIIVIRPGIASPGQPRVQDRKSHIPGLLTVSSIFPNKGLMELIAILEKLVDVKWSWHIIGEDRLDKSFTQQFRNRVHASTINKRVKIFPPLSHQELLKIYLDYDIFVLPSHFETCSMVTMEAMANGLPTIAWEVGGLAELVEHRKTGFLVPFGQEQLFLDYLRILIIDDKVRLSLGTTAKKRSMNFTSWKESAEQLVKYVKTTFTPTT